LLLLWALVFRSGSEPQQEAEKDQPPLAAAQSAAVEPPAPRAAAPAAESKSAPATGNVKTLELADLAELVGPSVVQVNVTGPEGAFTGSGFVLDKQGTIVTNYHVIEDATAGRIVFSDRTSAPITGYLGVWPEKDIALVRVECPPEKLHPLHLATSAPRQGERVAAFGSPLGLQKSMSEGIVSAVRESKELRALGPIKVNARVIQTTTPISHGNSGGPLVDMKGMVVGVNTMTFRPLGGENVNFAVAAAELPPLLLAKNETPSPLPASDPAAGGVRRILRRASAHMHAGDYDSAIVDYTEVIRLEPKNAFAYLNRGLAYASKYDFDSAIADFTEAIRLDPEYVSAYYWRGWAYSFKGDYDRCIADYTEAIRLDPEYASAYCGRGGAYHAKSDYDRAIVDYTEVIRLYPEYADAYCGRARAYMGKGDYDSAIADYTEVIRLYPKYALAYCGRARAYMGKDDYDSAIADYTEAIRLDPKNAFPYYFRRGLAYALKDDYDSAIADYTEAIRLYPKNAEVYYRRGLAYQGKGQRAAAERDFAQAKRLGYKP